MLSIIHGKQAAETARNLWEALKENLVVPLNEDYRLIGATETGKNQQVAAGAGLNPEYRFLHDRIQQAAYSLIPADQKQITHLQIGRLLLAHTPLERREERISAHNYKRLRRSY